MPKVFIYVVRVKLKLWFRLNTTRMTQLTWHYFLFQLDC